MSYYIEEVCVSIFCVLILECISLQCRARHVDRSNSRGSGSKPQEQLEYSWISLVIWPTYPYNTYLYISIQIHTYPIFGGLRSNGWRLECIQPLRHAWRMQISRTTTMEMRHFMDRSGTSGVFSPAWYIYIYPANLPKWPTFHRSFFFSLKACWSFAQSLPCFVGSSEVAGEVCLGMTTRLRGIDLEQWTWPKGREEVGWWALKRAHFQVCYV